MKSESTGLELAGLQWLLDHHKAKEEERTQMIEDLGLKPGDKVLDLACGPGLWSSLIAEQVKENGKVIAVDFDPILVSHGKQLIRDSWLESVIEFHEGDFYNLNWEDDYFDLVFFGNSLMYVPDEKHHLIFKEMKRVTKPGGRIAVKDCDGACLVINPTDTYLGMKVVAASIKGLNQDASEHFFNHHVGRQLNGLFLKEKLSNVVTKSYAIQKVYPLREETKRYIIGNLEWYLGKAKFLLSDEEVRQWSSYFTPGSDGYILDNEDFYYCMLEMISIGQVG